jgi:hypothetical protein
MNFEIINYALMVGCAAGILNLNFSSSLCELGVRFVKSCLYEYS